MASQLDPHRLDLEEQLVRIRVRIEESGKFSAETRKFVGETQNMPKALIFQAMLASAGLLGAGAAIAKLFFP